ncbi:DUF6207 family protein [Streptomyces coerulescens]|uniref:DUF6207 family protein n=1 Tax=Streptomyces coerulescens TaxID=29304 RepID=A0ABW0D041_STRCD
MGGVGCRGGWPINEAHVAEPGPAVVEVTAADDATRSPFRSCSPDGGSSRRQGPTPRRR